MFLWLLQLVPWLQVPISREEEDSNCWPTSPTPQQACKRVCTSLAEGKINELTKLKAPRGRIFWKDFSSRVSSCNQVPTTCPQGEPQTHPTLTPKWTGEIASNCEKSPHILQEGMHTLQAHTERNTNLLHKKAVALQMFGACISSGMGDTWVLLEFILASMIRLYGSR